MFNIELRRFVDMPKAPPREWLWEGLIPGGMVTILHGLGGSSKSAFLTCLTANLAAEREEFLGRELKSANNILWIDGEMDSQEYRRRTHWAMNGIDSSDSNGRLHYIDISPRVLSESPVRNCIETNIHQLNAKVIVVDSYGSAVGDPLDEKNVIYTLQWLRGLAATILIIDHEAKNSNSKTPYGSVYKMNLARSVLAFKAKKAKGMTEITISQTKANFVEMGLELKTRFECSEPQEMMRFSLLAGWNAVPAYEDLETSILSELHSGSKTAAELATKLKIKSKTVSNKLTEMKACNCVSNAGGQWHIILPN
jgi:RecA-family ATPase